jgi:hypothetical protein
LGYTCSELYEGPISALEGRPYPYYKHPYDGGEDQGIIKAVMFTAENRASFLMRRKISGVSESGLPWYRWRDTGKLFLSVKENAKGIKSLNVYGTTRPGRVWSMFKNITASMVEIKFIVPVEFIDAVNIEARRLALTYMPEVMVPEVPLVNGRFSNINAPFDSVIEDAYGYIPALVYPMFRTRNTPDQSCLMGKSFGARAFTEMEYTKTLFGKKNYRKDLVKAVAETKELQKIFFARAFRNQVPVDWIVTFLQKAKDTQNFPELTKEHLKTLTKCLKAISLTSRRRLLTELGKSQKNLYVPEQNAGDGRPRRRPNAMPPIYYVMDTLNFASMLTPEALAGVQFSSWKELHDALIDLDHTQRYGNAVIPETPLSKKISAIPAEEDFAIILPQDTNELRFWGKTMHHCIGTYANYAASGKNIFIGIIKEGEMIGNAQLDPSSRRCVQILGKRNRHLEPSDLNKVKSLFESHGVLPRGAFDNSLGVR